MIAEAVLAAVDGLVMAELGPAKGFRFYDDYEIAFGSSGEAEHAQGLLESALADFELVVNPFKTRIVELPQPFNATWTHELAAFPIRVSDGSETKTLNDLISLFSKAAEVANRHLGALAYALRKSQQVPVALKNWPTMQSLAWNAVSVEPTNMALALDLLDVKAAEVGEAVDKTAAAEVLESMIARHGSLRNASEVAWAVWAAVRFEVDLTDAAAATLAGIDDDFVALIALDANSKGRFRQGALDTSRWEASIGAGDALDGEHWLLAYESTRKGWLSAAESAVRADSFFAALLKRGVEFYDADPSRSPFTGPAAPLPGSPLPDSYF